MVKLADLIQQHLEKDQVPVFEFLRLRPGSSSGHEDTVRKTDKARVGEELSVQLIDRSATPQQWVALTRHPDFDRTNGLPADSSRRIRIKNRWYEADDEIEFFPTSAGCVAVRGGYAELGSSFHHARIYRCTKKRASGGAKTFYAMMRVYNIDLLPFHNQKVDLFTVELPPQCMSQRTSEGRLREALNAGEATQIGWMVVGDELVLDMSSQQSGAIGTFLEQFPGTTHWVLQSLFAPSRIHLRPRILAGEGVMSEEKPGDGKRNLVSVPASTYKILNGQGFRPSVDVIFGKCRPTIVRRNILGGIRIHSAGHLPVTWGVDSVDSSSENGQVE
jgi:CRISPR-associated endonuclease Csn1